MASSTARSARTCSWWLSDSIQNRLMGGPSNDARASLGLPPLASFTRHLFVDTPAVIAADDVLLPPDPAWGDRYPYAGFLFLDDPAPLDPALDAWLATGEPPVYVGFGSMAGGHPERVAGMLHDTMRASGRRCLVSAGAAGLFGEQALPDGFFVVREAPHHVLFPRVAAGRAAPRDGGAAPPERRGRRDRRAARALGRRPSGRGRGREKRVGSGACRPRRRRRARASSSRASCGSRC